MQIENLELLQSNLLTDCEEYKQWVGRSKKVYDTLTEANPFLEYRDYQYKYAALYSIRDRNICAGSCGIGKTIITGILIATIYSTFKRPGQIHIAAPNNLSINSRWLPDLSLFPQLVDHIEFITSEKQLLTSSKPIWIYNLDFLKRTSTTLKNRSSRNSLFHLMLHLHRLPRTLIIDEIHLLKPNTQRTLLWFKFCRKVKRILGLSGTLTDGRLDLVYNSLKLVYGAYFNYTADGFKKMYGANKKVETNYIGGTEFILDTNARYLNHLSLDKIPSYSQLTRQFIHRIGIKDPEVFSAVHLPNSVMHSEVIAPSFDHFTFYRNVITKHKEKLLACLNQSSGNLVGALTLIQALLLASNLPPQTIPNYKLQRLFELVTKHKKTVIFTQFIDVGRYLFDELDFVYPNRVIRLYASDPKAHKSLLSMAQRHQLLSEFLYNPDITIGVFSINLAAESIDLNVADSVIFYDLPWQAMKIQQAIHRAVRPGNPHLLVHLYFLAHHGFIDEHQYSLFEEKIKASNTMMDIDVPYTVNTQDALTIIKNQLGELL